MHTATITVSTKPGTGVVTVEAKFSPSVTDDPKSNEAAYTALSMIESLRAGGEHNDA